jgi:ubiquinone/menaquinone biosynthesis C-methylase UbiE
MDMNDDELVKLTISGYDKIAADWHSTRLNFWPELLEYILKYIKPNTNILDIGCGNGRLYKDIGNRFKENITYTGIDPSKNLIKLAKENNPDTNFEIYDGKNINYEDCYFDQIISIAVMHHIPKNKIIGWLTEAGRVAKKNSINIFTTWNLTKSNYKLENNSAVIGFMHYKDVRYVYNYNKEEIYEIFTKSNFKILEIKEISRESGMTNIVIITEKL